MDNRSDCPQPPNKLPCLSSKDGETSASPPYAAGISLPMGTIANMASIINPHARRASLRLSLCPSFPSNNAKLPSLQSVRFWLDNSGNDDCVFNNHNNSDKVDDGEITRTMSAMIAPYLLIYYLWGQIKMLATIAHRLSNYYRRERSSRGRS
jgi:hypothetical protein